MTGMALLTFDCEGLWGMADHLTREHLAQIDGPRLDSVYADILRILDEYQVPSTFAFVSLFATERDTAIDILRNVKSEKVRTWCEPAKSALESGQGSGWEGSGAFSSVCKRGLHEIASHGWSHLPWNTPGITSSDLIEEGRGIEEWASREQVALSTFVFPRNGVAAVDRLLEIGIQGYRRAPDLATGSIFYRLGNILSEFRTVQSEPAGEAGVPVGLPGGIPMNWRSGPRRVVPVKTSVARTTALLDHAVRVGGVAHIWTHPHNLITGSRQVELFEATVRQLAHFRKTRGLRLVTQNELTQQLQQNS